ncbi:4-hydroxythreonine-4-phosphate dehydrogenase [Acetobacter orientalis]|uniref:4-hydroxythreonine-4-phosphate dehydrogenase n=1 Tax=Acetobacter orientalis TaxID=146474 RepID=UPI0020A58539|nr:4-hydroxythreonine-4-phosphate dehydrogenase [Acetobacter orientalis]MCP1222322.1 4-hydroxythreonine-4-phosphate dehydrogenase [Acetobacter orientalis]
MTTPEFIFMLTRHDRTVENALDLVETVRSAGVTHIGFKDIGLPFEDLRLLVGKIRDVGANVWMEVVSMGRETELRSVRAACELKIDYLLGGTHVEDVVSLLRGTGIRYYPFPGHVVGHPSILTGTEEEITASAIEIASYSGVHGLDLLAWRFTGNVPELMRQVCTAVSKPVIIAGSIDRAERIREVVLASAAGFTIGTAALDGVFPVSADLLAQITYVQSVLSRIQGRS